MTTLTEIVSKKKTTTTTTTTDGRKAKTTELDKWRAVGTIVDKIELTDILTTLGKARGDWKELEYVTLGGQRRGAKTPTYLVVRGRFRRQTSWVALAFAVARLLGKPFDGIDGVDHVALTGLDGLDWQPIRD